MIASHKNANTFLQSPCRSKRWAKGDDRHLWGVGSRNFLMFGFLAVLFMAGTAGDLTFLTASQKPRSMQRSKVAVMIASIPLPP